MRRLLRQYEAANFADLLGLLVEHGVPYPEALRLAADAAGDRALVRLAGDVAAAVERGDGPTVAVHDSRALPPLLCWALATAPHQTALARSLHELAAIYRKQAEYHAERIRVYLPIILLLVIGLSATLFFGLCLFVPFTTLLWDLAIPS
jgi:general secretion pathway protein F